MLSLSHVDTCGLSVVSTFFVTIQFAVSEEELWRAVLLWAKRNSGVNKPTRQWTEEDNNKIREVKKITYPLMPIKNLVFPWCTI